MKLSLVLLFLNLSNVLCFKSNKTVVSVAFRELTSVMMKSYQQVEVINFDKNKDLSSKLLENMNKEITPRKIKHMVKEESYTIGNPYVLNGDKDKEMRNSVTVLEFTVMIFGTVQALRDFNKRARLENEIPIPFKMFVFCQKATTDEVLKFGEENIEKREHRAKHQYKDDHEEDIQRDKHLLDMEDILQFQYFLVDESESIMLLTFVWYTPQACHVPQLIEVNRFDKKTRKWKHSEFTIVKCTNFHGCELVIGIENFYPESQFKISNDTIEYGGFGLEIVGFLSEALNFKFRFNPFIAKLYEIPFFHYENLTCDLVLKFKTNAILETYDTFLSQPYMISHEYFTVPPGVPYDAYEKLILPFDLETWIWTLITFVVAYATIFIVHLMKVEVQNFVFGENVTTPSLNVLAAFCGISQVVMPRKVFARFIVMMFILHSFMIRNLYQGMMCDFLQTDMRGPEPIQSIEDISQKNFPVYFDAEFIYGHRLLMENLMNLVNLPKLEAIGDYENEYVIRGDEYYDHQFKGVIHLLMNNVTDLIKQSNGRILQRILNDNSKDELKAMAFSDNHLFFESFDQKIKAFIEAGILNREQNNFFEKLTSKRFKHLNLDEVKPMNVKHLEAAFVVWLVSLIFPIAAFIAEWIVRLKDFIVFKCIFASFNRNLEQNVRARDEKLTKALKKIKKIKQKRPVNCELSTTNQEKEKVNVRKSEEVQVVEKDNIQEDTIEAIFGELIVVDL